MWLALIPYGIIIAKFEVYGLRKLSINLLLDYLISHKQKVKIGLSNSLWNEVKSGVGQGSILETLILNAFIDDIFIIIEKSEICNLAENIPVVTMMKT